MLQGGNLGYCSNIDMNLHILLEFFISLKHFNVMSKLMYLQDATVYFVYLHTHL